MTNQAQPKFVRDADLPAADPAAVDTAYSEIMGRHVLASLRAERGLTLDEVARQRGVTKAAVHQIESKPFGKLQVSSVLGYLQSLGYDVDEDWLATCVYNALPAIDHA